MKKKIVSYEPIEDVPKGKPKRENEVGRFESVSAGISSPPTDFSTQIFFGINRLKAFKDGVIQAWQTSAYGTHLPPQEDEFAPIAPEAKVPAIPVPLLALWEKLPPISPATAILGLAENGQPLLLDLRQQGVRHMLIAGSEGAGKTSLLRSLLLSLAMSNRQAHVQMMVVSAKTIDEPATSPLDVLADLPHLLTPVMYEVEEVAEALQFLVDEMNYRLTHKTMTPTIVLAIDRLVTLLQEGGRPISEPLMRLAQGGENAGIHLITATRDPLSDSIDNLLRANLSLRVVGQTTDDAPVDTMLGKPMPQSVQLRGRGDFVTVMQGEAVRFQSGGIGETDMEQILDEIQKWQSPILLAQTWEVEEIEEVAEETIISAESESIHPIILSGEVMEPITLIGEPIPKFTQPTVPPAKPNKPKPMPPRPFEPEMPIVFEPDPIVERVQPLVVAAEPDPFDWVEDDSLWEDDPIEESVPIDPVVSKSNWKSVTDLIPPIPQDLRRPKPIKPKAIVTEKPKLVEKPEVKRVGTGGNALKDVSISTQTIPFDVSANLTPTQSRKPKTRPVRKPWSKQALSKSQEVL